MKRWREVLGSILFALIVSVGLSFLIMGVTTPRDLWRAYGHWFETRTPEAYARWRWEVERGVYIYQAKMAVRIFAVLFPATALAWYITKRRKLPA